MLFSHDVDDAGYWQSHYGQDVVWDFDPDKLVARTLLLPMVFQQPPSATKPKDPRSKRSRRTAEDAAKQAAKAEGNMSAAPAAPAPRILVPRTRLSVKAPPPVTYLNADDLGLS